MPFTLKVRRQPMLDGTLKEPQPGDYCFKAYKGMLDRWRAAPRWATVHMIYLDTVVIPRLRYTTITDHSQCTLDEVVATELAWQVFFHLYVMPYEYKKREENGEVE